MVCFWRFITCGILVISYNIGPLWVLIESITFFVYHTERKITTKKKSEECLKIITHTSIRSPEGGRDNDYKQGMMRGETGNQNNHESNILQVIRSLKANLDSVIAN